MPPDSNVSLLPVFKPLLYNVVVESDFNGSVDVNVSYLASLIENFQVEKNSSTTKEYNATSDLVLFATPDDPSIYSFDKWQITRNEETSHNMWNANITLNPYLDELFHQSIFCTSSRNSFSTFIFSKYWR